MTTLAELEAMGADSAAAMTALAAETARLRARLDGTPTGRSVERRAIEQYMGHLAWLAEALVARRRWYAAEAIRVANGGDSAQPPQTPTQPLVPPKLTRPGDAPGSPWDWWGPGGYLRIP